MDDLEFRRRLYADPASQSSEIHDAITKDPTKKRFYDELNQFEKKLAQAMQVEVPENLSSKIIFQQSSRQLAEQPNKSQRRIHLALVASLAFAFGVLTSHLMPSLEQRPDLASQALVHHYVDMDHHIHGEHSVSLNEVNYKLAAYGAKLTTELGKIFSVNYCQIDNTRALHIVYETTEGPASLLFIPKQNKEASLRSIKDDRFQVKNAHYKTADVLYVLPAQSNYQQIKKSVDQKLTWEI